MNAYPDPHKRGYDVLFCLSAGVGLAFVALAGFLSHIL